MESSQAQFNMPKVKESIEVFLKSVVKKYPSEFSTDYSVLFCKICSANVSLSQQKNFIVDQHRGTKKHKALRDEHSQSTSSQPLITSIVTTLTTEGQYCSDLCAALLSGK